MTRSRWLLAVLAACSLASPMAQAQGSFPSKPITMVIPFPPGGSTDPAGRLLAPRLAKELGQPVVIDNRAGVAGAIGSAAVARAAPDGHTILFNTGVVAVHPATLKTPGYDVRKDLVPVSMVAAGPYVLVVNPQLPVRNVPELIAYSKANPGKMFYGTSGNGSSLHLLTELFNKSAGIAMTHVPYKGNGPVMTALIGGEIQIAFDTIPGSKALAADGRVRMIAITGEQRSKLLPNIPTVAESGVKDFEAQTWVGMFLPAGTPDDIIQRWNRAIVKVLTDDEVRDRYADIGFVVMSSTPAQLRQRLDSDLKRWADTARSAGIKPE